MANAEAAQIPMIAAVDNFFESSVRKKKKTESLGAFNAMKNSDINFQKFQRRMEQHVPETTEKGTTSRGIPKFSEIYHRELQFYLTFRNSRMNGSILKTQQFRIF